MNVFACDAGAASGEDVREGVALAVGRGEALGDALGGVAEGVGEDDADGLGVAGVVVGRGGELRGGSVGAAVGIGLATTTTVPDIEGPWMPQMYV